MATIKTLRINVKDKIATYLQRDGVIVCGNKGYKLAFSFDEEWEAYPTKTARFIWKGKYFDKDFTGNECSVPVINDATEVTVGVYAGDLKTTTPAEIPCLISILCGEAEVADENIQEFRDIAQQAAAEAQQAATEAKKAATVVVHPTIDVEVIAGGHKLTIHDADGDESFNVMNGKNGGEDGEDGEDGATFTPFVSSSGILSWTNNKGLANPAPVNIKGKDGVNGTNGINGKDGINGVDGEDGVDGVDGVGIANIAKTSSAGLVDTYTITLTNGNIYTFTVTNGKDGEDGTDGAGSGLTVEQLANFTEMWNWYEEQTYEPMTLTITPTGKTYELGSKNTFTLTWTFSQDISSVTVNGDPQTVINNNGEEVPAQSKTITVEYKPATPANGEFKYKVVGTRKDGKKESKDATCTINFHNRFYWGYSADPRKSANDKLSNDFVRGLPTNGKEGSKGFSSGRANSFNITCDEGTYIWFAYPKRFGLATTSMAPRGSTMYFNGGFENPVEVSVTNDSKYTELYYVYRSINPGISQAVKVT